MGQPAKSAELSSVANTAGNAYQNLMSSQTPLEQEYIPQSQSMWNNYSTAAAQNQQDYSNIMGGYNTFASNLAKPTQFTNQTVTATNPAETAESYGYLRGAMPGYQEFAQTGGYSPTDIQELRARGVSPIRSAYSNTMMELNRSRALGGAGGSPNYIAAASKAQREMPGQMADAMTGVNAKLAEDIRTGKLAGLAGEVNVGGTMGGLASQEAGRTLQAGIANQNADLQRQQLTQQALQSYYQNQLSALGGQTSLYGTTPAMSATFGNQALQAYQNRIALEQARNNYGLGLLGTQVSAYGGQVNTPSWWQQLLNAAGSVAPYLFGGGSSGSSGSSGGSFNPSYDPSGGGTNTIWGGGMPTDYSNYSEPYNTNPWDPNAWLSGTPSQYY